MRVLFLSVFTVSIFLLGSITLIHRSNLVQFGSKLPEGFVYFSLFYLMNFSFAEAEVLNPYSDSLQDYLSGSLYPNDYSYEDKSLVERFQGIGLSCQAQCQPACFVCVDSCNSPDQLFDSSPDPEEKKKTGLLETFPQWLIFGFMSLNSGVYAFFFLFSQPIRYFTKNRNLQGRLEIPSTGEAFTLLGIVSAIFAIVAGLVPSTGVERFNPTLIFLTGTIIFLFLFIFLRNFVFWWSPYFWDGILSSSQYCLGWSLFALLDVLIPELTWRFLLLSVPLTFLLHTIIHLTLSDRFQRGQRQEEPNMKEGE